MATNTTFLDATYNETLKLVHDLSDYFAAGAGHREIADPLEQSLLVLELTRATHSLTDMMAWLLLRKAIVAGEIRPAEAARHEAYHLASPDPAGSIQPADITLFPAAARRLIERTRRIHEKAGHMDLDASLPRAGRRPPSAQDAAPD